MPIPARALEAANEIVARVPGTQWTPQDRNLAAALIAKHVGQEKSLEACRELIAAHRKTDIGRVVDPDRLASAYKLAQLALRS